MSWSVNYTGSVEDAKVKLPEQFRNGSKCMEPEETIRMAAAKVIALALDAQGLYPNVTVSAFGSMTVDSAAQKSVANSLSIIITPQS